MAVKGYRLKGRLVDGTLSAPIEDGKVVTEGETIVWTGPSTATPAQYLAQDYSACELPGRTLMPGLIDGHTHISFGEARSEEELALYTPVEFRTLRAVWNAKKVLQAGVTSAFDAATTYNVAQSVRDAIDSGMFEGPRFAVSGKQLTSHQGLEDSFPNEIGIPPGQAGMLVKGYDEIIEAIRYQVKDGVDAIKVSGSNDAIVSSDAVDGSAFTFEEYKAVADEAHRLGKLCTVHARSRDSVADAARAGFDVIFHASYIDDEGIDWCLKNKCVIVPTLPLLVNVIEAMGGPGGTPMNAIFQAEVDAAIKNLPRAYRAGVPLIQGSESGWSPIPYGHWHAREMEIFVQYFEFSNIEAIHAGTLGATRLFKRFGHRVGKLEVGRLADILVVNGNPCEDITVLQKPHLFDFIFKGGVPVDRTPPAPRKQMAYERHKIFLNGIYRYDAHAGKGVLHR
jgi:imidazolonepropionase-like amidohydrolase